jgi:hypothetical protein
MWQLHWPRCKRLLVQVCLAAGLVQVAGCSVCTPLTNVQLTWGRTNVAGMMGGMLTPALRMRRLNRLTFFTNMSCQHQSSGIQGQIDSPTLRML